MTELWRPAGLAARYGHYLRAMHEVLRASVPLMELAARRCAELGPRDPVAGPLGAYLTEHIDEERGHDDWLLADLAAAGLDPAPLLREQPPVLVARLVGPQYYWIEHFHPVALLGYITVLEGHAPAPWLAEQLAADTGLPQAAFQTVSHHAALDTGHCVDLERILDLLPLDPAQEAAVAVSALHTVDAATELFTRLARQGRPRTPRTP
ncbi:iron-containing redox enzyme family protein [Kitasatospora sp. NBC_01287]|uniref:iron-containing redox enzyme family protein n=1 Tax=Kitasatospora sp. NBC_01287 TaxID=2903573 RepID=UPI002253B05C|nr:iron-containing redox enzyme family protein [Kitasatospora sp. NBC_01287]MCX4744426.1 iron-containing redox enzyme family protein [Kitasatospora sp. NBC_01287]